ncbi:MAG: membrane protein insertion efficiency factor YidD [Clostridia bacterium]|nr:membrane protein insertion efficiency factor YidD [Clostridia bacterium]MBQ3870494.1 membrane protein insertion efficiency factor YidD [Clostridia bacterium]
MKKFLLFLIRFYRKYLSGLKKYPTCKYYPTCSEYGYECIMIHGWFKGSLLALWRILRCNPFSRGGVDLPPPKKEKKPKT